MKRRRMEVCKLVCILTLFFSSLSANHSTTHQYSFYSWLANVFESSEDLKCTLDRPLLVAPALVREELSNTTRQKSQERFLALSSCCGCDLEQWLPPDWRSQPPILTAIGDDTLRLWAQQIHRTWLKLGRKISVSTLAHPERSSLLHVPHPFLLPSLDSRELRYWESYWMLLGLLLGDMPTSSRMLILNLASLISESGYIPSGGRVYLASHSEPPVLAQMVDLYYKHTSDASLVREVLPSLVKEYDFWMRERSVELPLGTFNYYAASEASSLSKQNDVDDAATASKMFPKVLAESSRTGFSSDESGWGSSTRWSAKLARNGSRLKRRPATLPVDLNALIGQNEITLYRLHRAMGERKKAEHFLLAHSTRCKVFNKMFWSAEKDIWSDVDLSSGGHTKGFYGSSLVPLLWGCEQDLSRHLSVLQTVRRSSLLDYPGGIPSSLAVGGSRSLWDFPLAIAPLQWFPVVAWRNASDDSLRTTARDIARRWVESSYLAWERHHVLFDKLLSTAVGTPGTGAHVTASQTHFGWSSGVLLHFLTLFPDLKLSDRPKHHSNYAGKRPSPDFSGKKLHIPTRSILSIDPADSITSETAGNDSNFTTPTPVSRGPNYAWVAAPILVIAAGVVLVLCLIWCRWLFLAGETRYWRRVQNEHLQAAGQTGGTSTSRSEEEESSRNNRSKGERESSEEVDEHDDSDRRELFSSWDV